MTTLALNEITESGEVTFTNGQVSRQSSYSDCLELFGELISNGDYQLLTFYLAKNPLKSRGKEITIDLVFRNENVSSLKVQLSDNEITKLTTNLSTDRQKIAKVKEILAELLTSLTNKTGEKAKGRRYFRTYSWGFFDLINPTKRWPSIIVNYKTD
jgi:hypothetical protein